uniref:D-isomer specific 2-hydroxyacid dehydrogenase NAD-binding domain-containing protein n=1 Tax=Pygocentrus nattereri TaxID=42514 RepID=A0A3B4DAN0_PYGNA
MTNNISPKSIEKPCILDTIGQAGINKCFSSLLTRSNHLCVGSPLKVDRSLLQYLPKLKVVVNGGVGVDHLDIPLINSFGVKVYNTPHVVDNALADIGVNLMLACARKILQGTIYNLFIYHESETLLGSLLGNNVRGTTLGRIGYKVAKRAQSFDMKILYHSRSQRTEEEEKAVGAMYCEKMEELLKKSDFVTVVVNLSPQTQKLIGAKELAVMKPSSTLINIRRGKHHRDVLVDALQRKVIKAAALDVIDPEPLPTHPLLSFPNMIVGTHAVETTWVKVETLAALNDEQPPNEVKIQARPDTHHALHPSRATSNQYWFKVENCRHS